VIHRRDLLLRRPQEIHASMQQPANRATDDSGRKTVTVIERFRFLHHAILRDRPNKPTTPESTLLSDYCRF